MGSGRTLIGLKFGALSLIGLVMASNAADTAFYLSGLALFWFGVFLCLRMVHKYAAGH